jgi:hypothetical protein
MYPASFEYFAPRSRKHSISWRSGMREADPARYLAAA